MRVIKGLIIKDLLQLKSYMRSLLFFIVVFILISFQNDFAQKGNMLILMLTLGMGMFSIATFSYDDLAKADKYILTLPVSKKEVVVAKFLLVFLSTFLGTILGRNLNHTNYISNERNDGGYMGNRNDRTW